MKKRYLKRYVIAIIYIIVLGITAASINVLSKNLLAKKQELDNYHNYTVNVFDEEEIPVINEEELTSLPYQGENVEVSKEYYSKEDTEEVQEKSLIYYANTYMPNTGILYESDEPFAVLSIMHGTVKEIKEDEILGTVITIEHSSKLTSVYYTLGELNVKENDQVTTGQIIATSGTSSLETNKPNTLLIETYLDGKIVNPNTIFSQHTSEYE